MKVDFAVNLRRIYKGFSLRERWGYARMKNIQRTVRFMGRIREARMAKSEKQKQKLLHIARYLMEQTDDHHAVSNKMFFYYFYGN